LSGDVAKLHTTVMAVSSQKLSRVEEIQQLSMQMASDMNNLMEARSHVLGLYHHASGHTKQVQRWFRDQLKSKMSLVSEFQDARISQAMETFDSMWWAIRKTLDEYLEAAEEHVQATKAASEALRSYTAQCQTNFRQLQDAYAAHARAERKAHNVLKKTWSEVAFQVGLMASKVADGGLLDLLALADVKATQTINASEQEIDAFCADGTNGLQEVQKHLRKVTEQGLFGQTQRQLQALSAEIEMLRRRLEAAELGDVPYVEVAKEASARLAASAADAQSAANHLARDMAEHWRHQLCGGMRALLRMLF